MSSSLEGVTLLFDLDGTLVDSAPDLIGTLNRMLVLHDLPPVTLEGGRHLIGHGARALLQHGFAQAGAPWDEAASPTLFDAFIDDYLDHIADHTRPFDGVEETLDRLKRRGARLAVATNKRTDLALALTDALDLTRWFEVVAGPDRVSARKPSGAHLIETARLAGGDPTRAVMVGDSTTDTGAARDAAMPCVAVSFGYADVAPDLLGGDVTIDGYHQLEATIDALLGRRI